MGDHVEEVGGRADELDLEGVVIDGADLDGLGAGLAGVVLLGAFDDVEEVGVLGGVGGSSLRIQDSTKSCAVRGVPSDQTALRRVKVTIAKSLVKFYFSAMPGMARLVLGSGIVRPSNRAM